MIVLDQVSKTFGNFRLEDISFSVGRGEYIVLLGPSGAGKTVILELIAGLIKPDSGAVSGTADKKIGFIYQDYMLFPHLSVFDNIAYGLRAAKVDKAQIDEKVTDVADRLNIAHLLTRGVADLSGGEKQRVAIARAQVIGPDIFLLDEPTAALDLNKRTVMQRLFLKIQKDSGAAFIHVTHNFEEALSVADRIIVINEGKIVRQGQCEEVFTDPGSAFVASFLGYRNVFCGTAQDGIFCSNGIEFEIPVGINGEIEIAFKADRVRLFSLADDCPTTNCFPADIIYVHNKLDKVEATIDIGFEIQVIVDREYFYRIVKPGNGKVNASIDKSAIVVLK
jgi:ABC-type sugar transport system ATPase subunit